MRDIDPLIEAMDATALREERVPYYGELWPASIGMARWLGRSQDLAGRSLLELGCGVGLAGLAAGLRGARVAFSDYFDEALKLSAANARRNGLERFETLLLDWRDRRWRRPFDLIVGCDVLYERRHHAPILDLFERCATPATRGLFSDPGRVHLERFIEAARRRGLAPERHTIRIQEGGARVEQIHIIELQPRELPSVEIDS